MAGARKHISHKKEKTAVLLITPETGRLPKKMGGMSKFISGKSGGLGEVIAALCGGLTERGNGFLFRDYNTGGLWYGLSRSVDFHRRPSQIREAQLRRIMRETREKHSLERMIDGYMAIYEKINGGMPLM